jgi:CRP-like cAMP-binding protein
VQPEPRDSVSFVLLADTPMFRGLGDEPLRFVAAGAQLRAAAKGQVICKKGTPSEGLFLLLEGRVKLSMLSEEGAERVIKIVQPGQSFGEAAAFAGRPCSTYAEALHDSRLLFVCGQRLREAVTAWPGLALRLLEVLASRVNDLTADLEACCLHSASRRVADFLMRQARRSEREPDHAEVQLPAAKWVVASSLHLTPETFSRELHTLARDGVIAIAHRTIRVLSTERLRHRCSA